MNGYFLNLELPEPGLHPYCWEHTSDQYIRQLYAIVRKEKPELFVELGTYRGYSTNAIGEALLANHLEAGVYGVLRTLDSHQDFDYQAPTHLVPHVDVFVGNTQDADQVPLILGGELIDILFIDADHEYLSTKKDFETWAPFVKPGGIVLFHDIRTFPEGSSLYWNQVVAAFPGCTHSVPNSEMGILTLPKDWMVGVAWGIADAPKETLATL